MKNKIIPERLMEKFLFSSHNEYPLKVLLSNFMYGFGFTIITCLLIFIVEKSFVYKYFFGVLLLWQGIFFFGWGAEWIWYTTISQMVQNPFSFKAYLSRVPFWFISGGIGFSFTYLFAYKYELIYILNVPQWWVFISGGILECLIQIPLQKMQYRNLSKISKKIYKERGPL